MNIKPLFVFICCSVVAISCSNSVKEVDFEKTNLRNGIRYEVNSEKPFTGILYRLQKNEGGELAVAIQKIADKDFKPGYETILTYRDGKINGPIKDFYSNGQIKREYTQVDTIVIGVYKVYYENGQLKSERNFRKGKIDGMMTEYYQNGAVWCKLLYKDGKRWEIISDLRPDGTPTGSELKEGNGVIFGQNQEGINISKTTYQNGVVISKETF